MSSCGGSLSVFTPLYLKKCGSFILREKSSKASSIAFSLDFNGLGMNFNPFDKTLI